MVVLKALRSFILLIFLVLAFYFIAHFIGSYTGHMVLELDKDLESCLKEKDITLYIENYDMIKLKDMKTSEYLSNIKISGCVLNKLICIKEGIDEYPTWIIEGKKIKGDIDIFELADKADC